MQRVKIGIGVWGKPVASQPLRKRLARQIYQQINALDAPAVGRCQYEVGLGGLAERRCDSLNRHLGPIVNSR